MSEREPNLPPPKALKSLAARGGAVTLAAQLARIVLMLSGVVVLSRLVAPEDFGLLAMVVAVAGVAEIFRDFGLSMAALRDPDLTQQQRSNLFWINGASGLVLSLAVFLLSWPLAAFYREPALVSVMQWIAPIYLLNGLAAQFRVSIMQSLRFGTLAVIDVGSQLFALVSAIIIASLGNGVTSLIALQTIAPALAFALAIVLAQWWPSLPRRTGGMKKLLTFGVSFATTQVLSYATRNVDSIAIGRVWGPSALGYYDRAFQLAAAPLNQINAPLSRVAVPVLSRVVDRPERYLSALREAQLVASYVTATLLLVAAGLGTPLMLTLLGPEWAESGPIFSALAIGSVFRSLQQIAYWMFMTQGLAGSQLRLYLVGQPIIIACLMVGLVWGPFGVAVGSTVGWALFWLMSLIWVGRVSRLNVMPLVTGPLKVVALVGIPCGASALAATLIPLPPLLQVIVGTCFAIALFGFALLISRKVRGDARSLVRFGRLALGR